METFGGLYKASRKGHVAKKKFDSLMEWRRFGGKKGGDLWKILGFADFAFRFYFLWGGTMRVQIPFTSGNQLENLNHTILDRRNERTHHVYPFIEWFYIFVLYFFGGELVRFCANRGHSVRAISWCIHFFPLKNLELSFFFFGFLPRKKA